MSRATRAVRTCVPTKILTPVITSLHTPPSPWARSPSRHHCLLLDSDRSPCRASPLAGPTLVLRVRQQDAPISHDPIVPACRRIALCNFHFPPSWSIGPDSMRGRDALCPFACLPCWSPLVLAWMRYLGPRSIRMPIDQPGKGRCALEIEVQGFGGWKRAP